MNHYILANKKYFISLRENDILLYNAYAYVARE